MLRTWGRFQAPNNGNAQGWPEQLLSFKVPEKPFSGGQAAHPPPPPSNFLNLFLLPLLTESAGVFPAGQNPGSAETQALTALWRLHVLGLCLLCLRKGPGRPFARALLLDSIQMTLAEFPLKDLPAP